MKKPPGRVTRKTGPPKGGTPNKSTFAVIECEYRKALKTDHVTFSPDGQSIIGFLSDSGNDAGIAKWDADTGKVVETRSAEREKRNRSLPTRSVIRHSSFVIPHLNFPPCRPLPANSP